MQPRLRRRTTHVQTMELRLGLCLVDARGRSGAKGSQTIRLQRVLPAIHEKTDNGEGKANAMHWISFENDDFEAGSAMRTRNGVTLSVIQQAGCYNAQRDCILIVVDKRFVSGESSNLDCPLQSQCTAVHIIH